MDNILIYCTHCKKELGVANFKIFTEKLKGYDANYKIRLFCDENCYSSYKKQYEVETYNGNPIYAIECGGELRYMPYWMSHYYFTSIEDCKRRMDAKSIGIVY